MEGNMEFEIVEAPSGSRSKWDDLVQAVASLEEGKAVKLPQVTGNDYQSLRQTLSQRIPGLRPGFFARVKTIEPFTYVTLWKVDHETR
jgi:hypothetical protein